RRPSLFLFDEPLSNLDAALRAEVRVEIKKLHLELGATMVYVTHDQVEAMTLADQIVVLRAGRVAQAGAPLELYGNPANRFVAGFIGSPAMNFLTGHGTAGGIEVPGLGAVPGSAPAGAEVAVGIRPSELTLSVGGPHRIDLVEHLGGVSYAYMTAPSGERLVAELRGEVPAEGAEVSVSFPPEAVYLFDARTEARLA
ncbi:MAG: TOBE domain-containing protein, partial [Pseudomonadota bacterium]